MSSIEDPKQLSLRTGQTSQNALGINAPPSPAYKSAPADSSVDWNSTKDRALWKIISKASNSKELDSNQQTKTEGLSRTPSTRTLTQSRTGPPASPAQPSNRAFNTAFGNHRKPVSPQREISEPDSDPLQESESDSSSEGESQSMARSQAFRRPTNYNTGRYGYDDEDEDEDGDSSGGFLPFATTATGSADPAATLKSPVKRTYEQRAVAPDSSASSASSAAATQSATGAGKQREVNRGYYAHASPASALSPRHREELSKLSPRVRREGSEGTPSMGSSFSDLDGL
ncbi:hypothetical protein E4T50_15848 [Aureobasidium sp. EXF-12298]|nr:hypothetical protein E4T50_15848 [Aureobasidium sp. EXF-12298]KAI4751215.1 hypothetical protein E4T51_15529 [Aureobasidium sp. EXF-12344]KAI4782988.1 hypothetical protein E4T52_02169 [Aureobasidium sp. EXF-3400]